MTVADVTAPCLVADIDVACGIPNLLWEPELESAKWAWILVRIYSQPVGVITLALPSGGLRHQEVLEGLRNSLDSRLRRHAESAGATWPPVDPIQPLEGTVAPQFLASRARLLKHAPAITVVICTRERPAQLRRCLESLAHQEYPRYSVMVVDNAPDTDRSWRVAKEYQARFAALEYLVEPRPGLAAARNLAWRSACDATLAWIDDDEVADKFWLAELARGFNENPAASVVTGIMLPAQLRSAAQVQFEQYGGFHKHRGFDTTVFSPATRAVQSPLFPLPPFGAGGNMATAAWALPQVRGFNVALGAGTWSLAAEDTRLLTDLLLSGATVVYQPSAVTWHFHRESHGALVQQMRGYGAGLTAFYASLLISRPSLAYELVRLLPKFLEAAFGRGSLRGGELPDDFPSDLRWANRRGLAEGPIRYLVARAVARRRSRQWLRPELG